MTSRSCYSQADQELFDRYSDSGDEAHEAKVKALPGWAQSPALAAALYRQQHVDPRDIFGPIQPLSMQGKIGRRFAALAGSKLRLIIYVSRQRSSGQMPLV